MNCANPACAREFDPRYHDQLYCCHDCRETVRLARQTAQRLAARSMRECPVCHAKFTPVNGMRYCSKACSAIGWNEKQRIRRARYNERHHGEPRGKRMATGHLQTPMRYGPYIAALLELAT